MNNTDTLQHLWIEDKPDLDILREEYSDTMLTWRGGKLRMLQGKYMGRDVQVRFLSKDVDIVKNTSGMQLQKVIINEKIPFKTVEYLSTRMRPTSDHYISSIPEHNNFIMEVSDGGILIDYKWEAVAYDSTTLTRDTLKRSWCNTWWEKSND